TDLDVSALQPSVLVETRRNGPLHVVVLRVDELTLPIWDDLQEAGHALHAVDAPGDPFGRILRLGTLDLAAKRDDPGRSVDADLSALHVAVCAELRLRLCREPRILDLGAALVGCSALLRLPARRRVLGPRLRGRPRGREPRRQ